MQIFAERLMDLREDKSLSYAKLAEKIGVSPSMVFYWKKDAREPSAVHLKELALFFDVSADYPLGL